MCVTHQRAVDGQCTVAVLLDASAVAVDLDAVLRPDDREGRVTEHRAVQHGGCATRHCLYVVLYHHDRWRCNTTRHRTRHWRWRRMLAPDQD